MNILKKAAPIFIIFCISLSFSSCLGYGNGQTVFYDSNHFSYDETEDILAPVTDESDSPLSTEDEQTTEPAPEIPELYPWDGVITDYWRFNNSVEEISLFFNEIALSSDYTSNSYNPSIINKRLKPISYFIEGDGGTFSEEDTNTISSFFDELSQYPGFPGAVKQDTYANNKLYICFYSSTEAFNAATVDCKKDENSFYGIKLWTEFGEITDGEISFSPDIPVELKNSIIHKAIYQSVGLIADSKLRSDSITYSALTNASKVSDMDMLVFRILYSEKIKPGMNKDDVNVIIKEMYNKSSE